MEQVSELGLSLIPHILMKPRNLAGSSVQVRGATSEHTALVDGRWPRQLFLPEHVEVF
jgi:hypothetical protein